MGERAKMHKCTNASTRSRRGSEKTKRKKSQTKICSHTADGQPSSSAIWCVVNSIISKSTGDWMEMKEGDKGE